MKQKYNTVGLAFCFSSFPPSLPPFIERAKRLLEERGGERKREGGREGGKEKLKHGKKIKSTLELIF